MKVSELVEALQNIGEDRLILTEDGQTVTGVTVDEDGDVVLHTATISEEEDVDDEADEATGTAPNA